MIVDDTAWSEPGETAGTPDRYQTRTYRGCRISAGNNWRNRDGSYMRADDDVPEHQQQYIQLNAELSKIWPVISEKKDALPDADEWAKVKDKLKHLER